MDIKNEMLKRLKLDCDTLLRVKIPRALDNISDEKGVNTYRNLTKALAENIRLIEEYGWKLMYSEYEVGDESQRQVAIWEQSFDGKIRNRKVWNIEDDGSNLYANLVDLIRDTIREERKDEDLLRV